MRTCISSTVSELSQMTLDSLTLLISSICSSVKELGQPPFSNQNLSPCLARRKAFSTHQRLLLLSMGMGMGVGMGMRMSMRL